MRTMDWGEERNWGTFSGEGDVSQGGRRGRWGILLDSGGDNDGLMGGKGGRNIDEDILRSTKQRKNLTRKGDSCSRDENGFSVWGTTHKKIDLGTKPREDDLRRGK